MHHVRHFKANFDPPTEESLATDSQIETSADGIEVFDADSHVRNVCFVWEDGREAFFNYAYLIAADLVLSDTINVMLLSFGSYTVTLLIRELAGKECNLLLMEEYPY